jgi:hypothetical protein
MRVENCQKGVSSIDRLMRYKYIMFLLIEKVFVEIFSISQSIVYEISINET